MVSHNTIWATFEQWSPVAFLVTGGLFALPPVASGLHAVTGIEVAVSPAVIFAFLLVVFIGLLGLYPPFAERNARLAKGGVALLALTVAITLPAIGVFIPSLGYPLGEGLALAVVMTVAAGVTLTVATFGLATLWTGAHSRLVGGLLLIIAASVSFMFVAMLLYGHSTPEWVSVLVNGLMASSLGAIGYVLRTEASTADHTASTDGVPTR